MKRISATEKAVCQMTAWAEDDSFGYDQQYRWGERGDYDCSSAVISAWEMAGVPVKSRGASYTGNMYSVFLNCGFEDVTEYVQLQTGAGLRRGDVLLNHQRHTAMYCGDGLEVEASINELGKALGGQAGDQSGREFLIRGYRNYPWDCVLRYSGEKTEAEEPPMAELELPYLRYGAVSETVKAMQLLLIGRGFPVGEAGADGEYGGGTRAGLTGFQKARSLSADGVCGPLTWERLLKG